MRIALLISSILLALAASWSVVLVNRLRDWRSGFVILWLVATMSILMLTIGGQVMTVATGKPVGPGVVQQLAITGLALAAVIYVHVVFQRDALTGLANRARFLHRLKTEIDRMRRGQDNPFTVLAVSLGRLGLVNDSLGHALGDKLLMTVAKRLSGSVRAGDMVARVGGDEFALLLMELDCDGAVGTAERLRQDLSDPLVLEGQEVSLTARIGIVVGDPKYRVPDAMLRAAQLAMNRAKVVDQCGYEVYNASLHDRAVERLALESGLRRAAERGELSLYYQPIVSLTDGRVAGFEALLRWRHQELGVLTPARFIPMAEETDLIISIGEWVLERACHQMHEWRQTIPALSSAIMHVNLSGRQFRQGDLVAQVDRILRQSQLEPGALALEITESIMMNDAELAAAVLGEMRSLGVGLAVDDFGTGYSSLSYLSRFPIDTLKIDGSFVQGVKEDAGNRKIIRSIIALARDLELRVVAEGIETTDQLAFLRSLRCALGQGHFLGEPMSATAAGRLITHGRVGTRTVVGSVAKGA
jgi:diguanylate cyclase (GGDEF)-like protein